MELTWEEEKYNNLYEKFLEKAEDDIERILRSMSSESHIKGFFRVFTKAKRVFASGYVMTWALLQLYSDNKEIAEYAAKFLFVCCGKLGRQDLSVHLSFFELPNKKYILKIQSLLEKEERENDGFIGRTCDGVKIYGFDILRNKVNQIWIDSFDAKNAFNRKRGISAYNLVMLYDGRIAIQVTNEVIGLVTDQYYGDKSLMCFDERYSSNAKKMEELQGNEILEILSNVSYVEPQLIGYDQVTHQCYPEDEFPALAPDKP
jgi:hypothetical protein